MSIITSAVPLDAVGKVVIEQRAGLRRGMQVTGGLGVAGGVGLAVVDGRQPVNAPTPDPPAPAASPSAAPPELGDDAAERRGIWPPSIRSMGVMGAGAAVAVASLAIRPRTAPIVQTGLTNVDAAVRAAADLDRATGVMPANGSWSIVDLSGLYDLDNLRSGPESFRVGDGKVPFDALVTQDGDRLNKVANGTASGFENVGAAGDRVSIAGLRGKPAAAVEQALKGVQLGTDDDHGRLMIGGLVGSRTGYASVDAAAKAMMGRTSREALLVNTGAKTYALALNGPDRQFTKLRGTGIADLGNVNVASRKSVWSGSSPGERLDFGRRIMPFSTDELIGQHISIGPATDHAAKFDKSLTSMRSAQTHMVNSAKREKIDKGLLNTTGYAVIESGGKHHVYRLGGEHTGTWESELGRVRGVTELKVETKTESKTITRGGKKGELRTFKRQSKLILHMDNGTKQTIRSVPWATSGDRFIPG